MNVNTKRQLAPAQVAPDQRQPAEHHFVSRSSPPLLEVQRCAIGAVRSALRIVRDHHDGLAVLFVQCCSRSRISSPDFAIEVAGGLVSTAARGSVTMARAIPTRCLLAARKLPRLVLDAIAEADERQRRVHALQAMPTCRVS